MAQLLKLTIVSPAKIVFEGDVKSVELPGAEGDMGVLPEHAPLLTMLREGTITVHAADNSTSRYRVKAGYADVTPAGCTVLAEHIEAA